MTSTRDEVMPMIAFIFQLGHMANENDTWS